MSHPLDRRPLQSLSVTASPGTNARSSLQWRIRNAPHLLFSCMDNRSARRMIREYTIADQQVHRNGRISDRC